MAKTNRLLNGSFGNVVGPFQQAVLLVVSSKDGIALAEVLNGLTGKYEPLSGSMLAVTLDRMAKKGWVARRKGVADSVRGGKAKWLYSLTDQGHEIILEAQIIRDMLGSLPRVKPLTDQQKRKLQTPEA